MNGRQISHPRILSRKHACRTRKQLLESSPADTMHTSKPGLYSRCLNEGNRCLVDAKYLVLEQATTLTSESHKENREYRRTRCSLIDRMSLVSDHLRGEKCRTADRAPGTLKRINNSQTLSSSRRLRSVCMNSSSASFSSFSPLKDSSRASNPASNCMFWQCDI